MSLKTPSPTSLLRSKSATWHIPLACPSVVVPLMLFYVLFLEFSILYVLILHARQWSCSDVSAPTEETSSFYALSPSSGPSSSSSSAGLSLSIRMIGTRQLFQVQQRWQHPPVSQSVMCPWRPPLAPRSPNRSTYRYWKASTAPTPSYEPYVSSTKTVLLKCFPASSLLDPNGELSMFVVIFPSSSPPASQQ